MVQQETLIVEKALWNLETNTGLKAEWRASQPIRRSDGSDGRTLLEVDKQKILFNVLVRKELRRYQLNFILEMAHILPP